LFLDESQVNELVELLKVKKIGVVAHFYMDPEVQGVLTAAQKQWPHIHISDSLVMADSAVKMAEAGCQFIAVLGVDFMSENVRAILDQAGYEQVTLTSHQCHLSPLFEFCGLSSNKIRYINAMTYAREEKIECNQSLGY